MLRPNLFSVWTLLTTVCVCSGIAHAQNYLPEAGPYQHQPLFQMPQSTYQAPIVDHYVQRAPRLWDDQQPIEWFLGELAKRSWLKVEYLHWQADGPGDHTAGAAVTGLDSNDSQFDAIDPLDGTLKGTAELFRLDSLGAQDGSGARGTWGLDINGGQMELSFFGTQNISGTLTRDVFQQGRIRSGTGDLAVGDRFFPNIALPLTINGAVSSTATMSSLIFDKSVSTTMTSQIWGSELALLTDTYMSGEGMHWQWLGGFRYVNIDEDFKFLGLYDNGGALTADRVTSIKSKTINNVYGPEVGARASLVHRWFTLSATPRIAFGLNDNQSRVTADPLGLGATTTNHSEVDFCPITQVSFTGEVNLSTAFSVYGGYDFMWLPEIARATDTIRYDSTSANGFDPNIAVFKDLSSIVVQGLSIGATFRY